MFSRLPHILLNFFIAVFTWFHWIFPRVVTDGVYGFCALKRNVVSGYVALQWECCVPLSTIVICPVLSCRTGRRTSCYISYWKFCIRPWFCQGLVVTFCFNVLKCCLFLVRIEYLEYFLLFRYLLSTFPFYINIDGFQLCRKKHCSTAVY